jgi:hypothetical protein
VSFDLLDLGPDCLEVFYGGLGGFGDLGYVASCGDGGFADLGSFMHSTALATLLMVLKTLSTARATVPVRSIMAWMILAMRPVAITFGD